MWNLIMLIKKITVLMFYNPFGIIFEKTPSQQLFLEFWEIQIYCRKVLQKSETKLKESRKQKTKRPSSYCVYSDCFFTKTEYL